MDLLPNGGVNGWWRLTTILLMGALGGGYAFGPGEFLTKKESVKIAEDHSQRFEDINKSIAENGKNIKGISEKLDLFIELSRK